MSDKEFFLGLLIYHLTLRCFIVLDLKRRDFKPEYAGKTYFYCSVVDDRSRHASYNAAIGGKLCRNKARMLAAYTWRELIEPAGVADHEIARTQPVATAYGLPGVEKF